MGARNENDFYIADLLSDILAGGNSSRIEEKLVREQKLFVEADVFLSGENDPGLFVATGKVSENVDFGVAQQALVNEILLTTIEKISEYELEKVKNKVQADLLYNEIGYLEKAIQLASYEILDNAELINDQAVNYERITSGDLLRVAKEIFRPGNRNTLNYFSNKKKQ
jgi:predicted Zn-dependent peptidase